jgi:hypothetical protein
MIKGQVIQVVISGDKNLAWDIIRLNIQFKNLHSRDKPGPPGIYRKWHLKGFCSADYPRKNKHVLPGPAKQASRSGLTPIKELASARIKTARASRL